MIRTSTYYAGWNIVATAMLFQAVIFGLVIYSFTMWVPTWADGFATIRLDARLPGTTLRGAAPNTVDADCVA